MANPSSDLRESTRRSVYSTSGINILAGVWLVLAPFALGYAVVEPDAPQVAAQAATWNAVILGIAIAVLALIRVGNPLQCEEVSWVNFVLGIWLIIAPFALGYSQIAAAMWNDVLVGIVVLILAAASAAMTRRVSTHGARAAG